MVFSYTHDCMFPHRMNTEASKESTEPADTSDTQTSDSELNLEKGERIHKTQVVLAVTLCKSVYIWMLVFNTYGGFVITEESTKSCENDREPPPKPPHTYYNKHCYPDGGESRESGEPCFYIVLL